MIALHAKDLNHGGLCDELKLYKKEWGFGHAGHLWEHTVWVVKAMERFIYTKSKWIEGIDEQYWYLMVVAAFLHDVGKAGDKQYTFHLKPCHPATGFQFLAGNEPFYKSNESEVMDFKSWLQENEISEKDREILLILVGMHQEFGSVLNRIAKKPEDKKTAFAVFLERLISYCRQAGYRNGYPDELIIRMSIAICVADIEGMFPVSYPCAYFPDLQDEPQTLFNATRYFDYPLLDTKGYMVAQELITYCKKRAAILGAPYCLG